ncbi:MAG: heterodisulfide reductase-related iron-sulfur binding cluster [Caldilineaceae bacterium]
MAESSMCCGSAGTYNILQPEMAQQLLDRKLDNTAATEAEIVLSANTGCMIQLRRHRPTVHERQSHAPGRGPRRGLSPGRSAHVAVESVPGTDGSPCRA